MKITITKDEIIEELRNYNNRYKNVEIEIIENQSKNDILPLIIITPCSKHIVKKISSNQYQQLSVLNRIFFNNGELYYNDIDNQNLREEIKKYNQKYDQKEKSRN